MRVHHSAKALLNAIIPKDATESAAWSLKGALIAIVAVTRVSLGLRLAGVSLRLGSLDPPIVAAEAEQVERTRRKTWSRARFKVFVPYTLDEFDLPYRRTCSTPNAGRPERSYASRSSSGSSALTTAGVASAASASSPPVEFETVHEVAHAA